MGTKKHSGILQRLEARSADSYEKVASRMRLAIKIADAIEHSGMSKKEFAIRLGKLKILVIGKKAIRKKQTCLVFSGYLFFILPF